MIIALAIIGCLVGLLSGLLGIGGGIIIVPALNIYFQNKAYFDTQHLMHISVATSITIVLFTALMTSFFYAKQHKINWDIFKAMCPGLALGGFTGSYCSRWIEGAYYHQLFGIFLLVIAIKVFFFSSQSPHPDHKIHVPFTLRFLAILIGLISSVLGISGGIILTPLFFHYRLHTLSAIGTATICTLPIVFTSSIVLNLLHAPEHIPGLIGYVYWPAVFSIAIFSMLLSPVGGKLSKILPEKTLKILLGLLLIVSAGKMLTL
jgi:uncharacterized membrane protein YfcA